MHEFDEVFKAAIQAGKERDYAKSIQLLTQIATHADEYPVALLYLGRSYHAVGQYNQAVQVLNLYVKVKPDSHTGYFFLGRTYLALNLYKQAIYHLKTTLSKNPNFLPALSLMGLSYLKVKRPETALHYFEQALKIDPDNKRIFTGYLNSLMVKAMHLFQKDKIVEAEEIFRFILQYKKNSILPHLYLARIYKDLDRLKPAIKHYETASQLSPKDPVIPILKAALLLQAGEVSSALNELNKSSLSQKLFLSRIKNPEGLLKIATVSLFQQNRYSEAITYGVRLLKQNYKDADIHFVIAECYHKLGDYIKAKNHILRCIEIDKNRIEYYHRLAINWWKLKEYNYLSRTIKTIWRLDESDKIAGYFYTLCLSETGSDEEEIITSLQNQIRDIGPDLDLMLALGKAYFRNNLEELSANWFKRVIKLDEKSKESYLYLIQTYKILKKKKEEKEAFSIYLNVFPEDYAVRREYIHSLLKLEDYKKAVTEINILLPVEPNNRILKKNLSFCYLKLERYQDAVLIYRDLLKDEPKSVSLLRSLIYCLNCMGNYKTSIMILEKAIKLIKDNPAILLPLGVLYSKENNYEKANEIFRSCIAINPKDWKAYHNLSVLYKRMGQNQMSTTFANRARKYKSSQA